MCSRVIVGIVFVISLTMACWALYNQHVVRQGEEAFVRVGCADCHRSGAGPSLVNVTRKYDRDTLRRFVANPEDIYRERARRPLNAGYPAMPKVRVSQDEVKAIITFLERQDD